MWHAHLSVWKWTSIIYHIYQLSLLCMSLCIIMWSLSSICIRKSITFTGRSDMYSVLYWRFYWNSSTITQFNSSGWRKHLIKALQWKLLCYSIAVSMKSPSWNALWPILRMFTHFQPLLVIGCDVWAVVIWVLHLSSLQISYDR